VAYTRPFVIVSIGVFADPLFDCMNFIFPLWYNVLNSDPYGFPLSLTPLDDPLPPILTHSFAVFRQ